MKEQDRWRASGKYGARHRGKGSMRSCLTGAALLILPFVLTACPSTSNGKVHNVLPTVIVHKP